MTATDLAPVQERFPLHPPARYFEKPDWLAPGQKLSVVSDGQDAGRVAGYVAPWDQCIIDGQSGCWTVPASPSNYMAAMQGQTMLDDGTVIRTGNIGGGVNHARVSAKFAAAVDHYANTGAQTMRVVYGEDDYGIWCAGAVWPDLTDRDLAVLRASALSGDWRVRPEVGAFDLCGVQLVNQPGFPLVREFARAASIGGFIHDPDRELPSVYIGGLGGVGPLEDDEPCCAACGTPQTPEARMAALGDALLDRIEAIETHLGLR